MLHGYTSDNSVICLVVFNVWKDACAPRPTSGAHHLPPAPGSRHFSGEEKKKIVQVAVAIPVPDVEVGNGGASRTSGAPKFPQRRQTTSTNFKC